MQRRIITLLITGTVLTAGLLMGFGGYVFAGDPVKGLDITICQNPPGPCSRVSDTIYDSSFSKTKSIGLVRKEVGDVLLRYGVGGADINKVTEALEGKGVYEAELKWFLLAIGINEKDAQDILLEFDKIGISGDSAQKVSAPDATGDVPKSIIPAIDISLDEIPSKQAEPVPACPKHTCTEKEVCVKGICVPSSAAGTIKDILPSKRAPSAGDTPQAGIFIKLGDLPEKQMAFGDSAMKFIQDLKAAESDDQLKGKVRHELQANRETLQKSAETLRQNLRENAKELRENFRENVKTTIGHVDHGKTGRIAVAHGKGLRMLNRFRSAISRFDHILGRLEVRIEKIGIEIEAQARAKGQISILTPPPSVILLIEKAKNTQVENEAKLVQLEAKYESLLTGENPGGIAEEARAIAKELKTEIENLHGLLDDIKLATGNYNSSLSNKDK